MAKNVALAGLGFLTDLLPALRTEIKRQGGKEDDILRATDKGMVKQFAALLVAAGRSVVEGVANLLSVDYTRTLADMVAEGKYNLVNDNIIAKNFPHDSARGAVEVEWKLFHFSRDMASEETIAEMMREGYRPADLSTLCAFGTAHPDIQREFPVVALGSVWRGPNGGHFVPCLYMWVDERHLSLYWFAGGWGAPCRFLAVREVPAS